MKVYLRLIRHLLRYKIRLVVVVVFSVLVATMFGFQIGSILPTAGVIFNPDFDVAGLFEGAVWQTPFRQRVATFVIEQVSADKYRALVCVCCFVIAITILGSVCRFLQEYNARYIATRLSIDVSNRMYRHTIHLSLSFFDRVGVGESISRFTNDVALVNRGIVDLFSTAVSHPLRIVVGLGWAFWIDAELAVVGLLLFPVAGFVLVQFGQRVRRATRRTLKRQASIVALLQETFVGIRIVKAFAMEPYETKRFENENRRLFRYFMKIAVADEMVKPLMEMIGVIALVGFFLFSGKRVLDGTMEPEEFFTFYTALVMVYDPVRKLSKVFTNIQKGVASGKRVFAMIDCEEFIRERPDAVELVQFNDRISFRDVSFSYRSDEYVLRDINLDIHRGEMVAFVGASGAGKTTLVNLVPRFYDVDKGSVTIDGTDLRDVTLRSLRTQIAVVTQDVVLFNDTVRNNIAYGHAECDDERIVAAARAADADAFIEELPDGYDTVLAERGQSLSGGQRQRLAIARAIAKDPAILILDEATSSLDSESEQAIQNALDEFVKGRTTLVIAHRLSTVLRADKIVVLDTGRIVGMGTHAELLEKNEVYRRLYDAQFRNVAGSPTGEETSS